MKGIQIFTNDGQRPFPRGDDGEIVKIYWQHLKFLFFRITVPISTKLFIAKNCFSSEWCGPWASFFLGPFSFFSTSIKIYRSEYDLTFKNLLKPVISMLLIYLRYYHVNHCLSWSSEIRPPNYLINACLVICVIDCLRPHTYRLPYHLSFGES